MQAYNIQHIVNDIEDSMINTMARRMRGHGTSDCDVDFKAIRQQVVYLGNEASDDELLSSRLLTLLMMCAYLTHDLQAIGAYTQESLKILRGTLDAKTEADAYLLFGLFLSTHHPECRTKAKEYVRRHPDCSRNLHRFYGLSKNVRVRKSADYTKEAYVYRALVAESVHADLFVPLSNRELTDSHTDGQPCYRLVTIGKALENPTALQRLKASRKAAYTPKSTDSLQRLSSLAGMSIARMDPTELLMAFDLLKTRFQSASSETERMQTLVAMYHAAGCDSHLLMASLKQQCDHLYDTHFAQSNMPQGLFDTELCDEFMAYQLQFYRYYSMPGSRTIDRRNRRCRIWCETLKRWADKLVASDTNYWRILPLTSRFLLLRILCHTGYLTVAHGCQSLANRYKHYVASAFFDCYLQLVNSRHPDTPTLVFGYQALCELKYNLHQHQSFYNRLLCVISRRQSTLPPATDEWLQLEELTTAYAQVQDSATSYHLLCPDTNPRCSVNK